MGVDARESRAAACVCVCVCVCVCEVDVRAFTGHTHATRATDNN